MWDFNTAMTATNFSSKKHDLGGISHSMSFIPTFNKIGWLKLISNDMKIKVTLFLCLNKYHVMKTYREVEEHIHTSTSVLYGVEWSDSRPDRFNPRNSPN
jgi:hypothetical protein